VRATDEDAAWRVTEQVLLRFFREVTDDGGRFGVVVIPSQDAAASATVVERLQLVSGRGPFPVLDLGAVFAQSRVSGAGEALTHTCDAHWNSRGHREAAMAVRAFLERQQWLSNPSAGPPDAARSTVLDQLQSTGFPQTR
jgi:hypothetical protein